MHIFWIAGLLLALIDMPDFGSSLGRIAESTEKMAGIKSDAGEVAEAEPEPTPTIARSNKTGEPRRAEPAAQREGTGPHPKPDTPPRRPKELRHA